MSAADLPRGARDAEAYLRNNRELWRLWTPLKAASTQYDLAGFRVGGSRMRALERAEVGEVRGRSLLHLQCHVGIDTLSWARLGARVTGVDFAAEGVATARSLAADIDPSAVFVEADVLALPDHLDGHFDIVYTSHGVLGWLPDLRRWAEVVAHFIAPGGFVYVFESHPAAWMLDNRLDTAELRLRYSYFGEPEPLSFEYRSPTAVPDREVPGVEYAWGHSLGEIVSALASAGLTIEFLHEWPFVAWRMLPCMVEHDDYWWRLPDGLPSVPLSFSLRASKPPAPQRS
ncbi:MULTISPECIES: class I SAM-dependent methyltransferase [unclassified Streptomyces]|uniref:class I SAM-dependent methyltransferase n=1 Tax=Streptomyces TaxID=1883 RepID=UPI00136F8948|nr:MULTISPECIES: class I SAM-dependent methyltransferase [unclassified Streptomyces]NEA03751.1 methyltransferase domain-containing protein [Streptomyces sp. SID10116]MYY84383.1 methyltransferase domain-containing protein [Streptomyces sp. SID335]MYZ19029.1 methyltransferase domain-containing protein [Streptomyces sp. SID337]NDZ89428.1 methyltransferase domain-containing protein [Streptomyces sp. SID10115]NDZ90199.1 methyltransferase domain-containing protein [Streptomyces sp. SID10115]